MDPKDKRVKLTLDFASHGGYTVKYMNEAFEKGYFTDMAFMIDHRLVVCHKIVIANTMTKFSELLLQSQMNGADKTLVIYPNVQPENMHLILKLVYSGEVSVDFSKYDSFLRDAIELGVKGIEKSLSKNEALSSDEHFNNSSFMTDICAASVLSNMRHSRKNQAPAKLYLNPKQKQIISAQAPVSLNYLQPAHAGPHTAEQPPSPPQLIQCDFPAQRFKAAACRGTSTSPVTQQNVPNHEEYVTSSENNGMEVEVHPGDQYHQPAPIDYHNYECDSDSDDAELHIDEGREEKSPMEFCERNIYIDGDEECEPQDLRVESRQNPQGADEAGNSLLKTECSSRSPFSSVASSSSSLPRPLPKLFASNDAIPSTSSGLQVSNRPLHSIFPGTTVRVSSNGNPIAYPLNLFASVASASIPTFMPNDAAAQATSSDSSYHLGSCSPEDNEDVTGSSSAANSKVKKYTHEDLCEAIRLVLEEDKQPVEVIKKYSIPRRTFFRHLSVKRLERGVEPKSRAIKKSPKQVKFSPKVSPSSGRSTPSSANNAANVMFNLLNGTNMRHNYVDIMQHMVDSSTAMPAAAIKTELDASDEAAQPGETLDSNDASSFPSPTEEEDNQPSSEE